MKKEKKKKKVLILSLVVFLTVIAMGYVADIGLERQETRLEEFAR